MLLIFSLRPCFSFKNFRCKKYEKDLMNDAWIIDFDQITLSAVDNRFANEVSKPEKLLAVSSFCNYKTLTNK